MINSLVNSYSFLFDNVIFYLLIILLIIVFIALRKINPKTKSYKKNKFILTLIFLFIVYSFFLYYFENRARNYLKQTPKNIEKAIQNRELAAKLSINPFEKNMLYNHLTALYFLKKDYKSGINAHEKGCKIIKNQELISTFIVSKTYIKLGDYDNAIKVLLNKNNVEKNDLNKMLLYSEISKTFIELKSYKLVYNYINEYFKLYNKHRCLMNPPCEMVKRRVDLSKKINRQDFVKKDEEYLSKYCKIRK